MRLPTSIKGIGAMVLLLLVLTVGGAQQVVAGRIAVVADVNAVGSGNMSFYDAFLGSNQVVIFSQSQEQQGNLFNHYNTLAGVSATESGATLTASFLGGIDMLVATRFFDSALTYTATEIANISNFVVTGGSVLLITESRSTPTLSGYNAFLSGIGSSISYTGMRYSLSETIVANPTSLGALNSFAVDAYNTLSGGTSVYDSINGSVVAFETSSSAPVPEPATVALLGIGLVGLAGVGARRRRKKKAEDKS